MSNEANALVPLQQKQVLFYNDEITAVLVQEQSVQHVYVPLRPLVENLGLAWSGQYERVQRDAVLSEQIRSIRVTRPEPGRSDEQETVEVTREMLCLPLDYLNGWLFSVNASRVKEAVRDRLIRYQRECYRVLYEAFQEGRLSTTAEATFEELLQQSSSEAVEAYRMLQAMIKMARNQIMLEARIHSQDIRLEGHESQLEDHEMRLEQVETVLGDPKHHITPEQASQISQAVKAVAHELGKRSGRNEYGGVYGELYRRYSINSYKELPKHRYDEAMAWLNDWLQSLVQDSPF